jgi:hypothetical protein
MQTHNEMVTHGSSLLASKIQPVKRGAKCTTFDAANRLQAIALDQPGNHVENHLPIGPHGFEERASISIKGMEASGAIIATFGVAINFDVWAADLAKICASSMVTPLGLSLHGASPRLVMRP